MLLNVLKTLRRLRQFLSGSFVFRIFAVTNLYLYGREQTKKDFESLDKGRLYCRVYFLPAAQHALGFAAFVAQRRKNYP